MTKKYYTGIGSRETPEEDLEMMRWLANKLYFAGYTLRSGGATGADQEFECGLVNADKNKMLIQERSEIYLPWPDFEKSNRTWLVPKREHPQLEAFVVAQKFHPAWKRLTNAGRKFHARNVHQIYGYDVNNPVLSDFVICWTKDAKGGGGTGQAIRIAKANNVPIYDLADEESLIKLLDSIKL